MAWRRCSAASAIAWSRCSWAWAMTSLRAVRAAADEVGQHPLGHVQRDLAADPLGHAARGVELTKL
jgi:alkylhydroperoxidase family enzyme